MKLIDILREMALFPKIGPKGEYTTDLIDVHPPIEVGTDFDEVLPTNSVRTYSFSKGGLKIHSAYPFNSKKDAPSGFKTALRKAVKDTNNIQNLPLIQKLIQKKVKYLKLTGVLDNVNAIIPLGSTSKLNLIICDEIKKQIPQSIVLEDLLTKVKWKNVKVVDRGEKSKKGYELAKSKLEHMIKLHPDEDFQIKKVGSTQSIRRYFSMFYEVSPGYNIDLLKKLTGSNILLIDDTIEEGVTIEEANRVIEAFMPNKVEAFVFLSGN